MPHVQIVGPAPLVDLVDPLAQVIDQSPRQVLKIKDAYMGLDEQRLLLEGVVIEGHLRQSFFLLLRQAEDGLIVRCHPSSPVQKTAGVKALIALVARTCQAASPGSRIGNDQAVRAQTDFVGESLCVRPVQRQQQISERLT